MIMFRMIVMVWVRGPNPFKGGSIVRPLMRIIQFMKNKELVVMVEMVWL